MRGRGVESAEGTLFLCGICRRLIPGHVSGHLADQAGKFLKACSLFQQRHISGGGQDLHQKVKDTAEDSAVVLMDANHQYQLYSRRALAPPDRRTVDGHGDKTAVYML